MQSTYLTYLKAAELLGTQKVCHTEQKHSPQLELLDTARLLEREQVRTDFAQFHRGKRRVPYGSGV